MDRQRLGEVIGAGFAGNEELRAENWFPVFDDEEILTEAERRGLVTITEGGVAAVEGAMREEADTANPDTEESIVKQLTDAIRGYKSTLDTLNDGRRKKDVLAAASDETVVDELKEWLTEDKLAYVAAAQEADPELIFDLVATPNVTATADEVIKSAQNFGEAQPYSTSVWSDIIKRYKPEEVSGTNPSNDNSVQFSLVPRKLNSELYGTTDFQKRELAKLQADNPFVRATSPLEDLARLYTLRAQGVELKGSGTADMTYMRNFTMEEQRLGGLWFVPASYVSVDGWLCLDLSNARNDRDARVAVG